MVFGNFIQVILAAVVGISIGMVWYSQTGFGKLWLQLSGVKPSKEKMPVALVGMTLSTVITASILSCFVTSMNVVSLFGGIKLGFMCWLGFSMPVNLSGVLWSNKSLSLFALNTGCDLATMCAMGAVIALF